MAKAEAESIKTKLYQAIKENNPEKIEEYSKQLEIDYNVQKQYFEKGLSQ